MRQKYFTESTLSIYSSTPILTIPSELEKIHNASEQVKNSFKDSNIYLITKRPRVTIVKESLKYENMQLFYQLKFHLKGGYYVKDISETYGDETCIFEVSEYPHTKLIKLDNKGNVLQEYTTLQLVAVNGNVFDGHNDLEVIYIGQAYGKNGERTAIERLLSHSTLQKILADLATSEPHMEVILALYKFEYHQFLLLMNGTLKGRISGNKDTEHYMNIMKAKYKRDMNISLAEAGLIRYFEPQYNKTYKTGFPYENKYKMLDKLYKLDFAGLSIEINNEDYPAKLFSEKTEKRYHHIANYDLHTNEYRKTFFFTEL